MRFLMRDRGYKLGFVPTVLIVIGIEATICILLGMFNFISVHRCARAETIGLIASFSTYYGESSANRKHNVALAASKIDGTVLYTEDEFSFNDIVGLRREEFGFKSAYIIKDGEFVEGIGGGVCQVSSTVYNAALLADLYITRVRPHSLPVSYVLPSFDAMVSSASDLRFVNTLAAPVTIKMTADGKYLKCEIYGVAGRQIRRRSEVLETIPNEIEYRDDAGIPLGKEVVDSIGHEGVKSRGYLEYFENGKMVASVLIRKDNYAPQKRVVLRGIKEDIEGILKSEE